MNTKQLMRAMSDLDDALVASAAQTCQSRSMAKQTGKKRDLGRRFAVLAAAAAVFAALGITAYATNLFGLQDYLLGTTRFGMEEISVVGANGSDIFAASAEWSAFYDEYMRSGRMDTESMKDGYATAGDAQRAGAYFFYGCCDKTMIQTLQEIADKYGLAIHTERTAFSSRDELLSGAGAGDIFGDLDRESPVFSGYYYEDGSYKCEMGLGMQLVTVCRTVKGTIPPYSLFFESSENVEEVEYTTRSGQKVLILLDNAVSDCYTGRAIALYETDTSVASIIVLGQRGEQTQECGDILEYTRGLLDRMDLGRLDG